MLQQLLVLGRLDPQERGRLEVDPVDVVELAREVGETYLDAAIARDIELEFTSDESEAFVSANADLLAEALGNLLDNAIQYTRVGGKVRITVRKQRSQVVLAVHDSGPGIPSEERDRLFERFVRGARAPGDGSGLGLAIVKDIATMQGANVVLNDSPLGGVRVTLSLPALGESASSAPAAR